MPALTGTSSAPGHLTDTFSVPSQWAQPHLSASASHVGSTDILTLPIKASATVTVYRGHPFTCPFIMCIGIIRNNSLGPSRTPATERVTLYCTWRPSALTTRPRKQVKPHVHILLNFFIHVTCGRVSALVSESSSLLISCSQRLDLYNEKTQVKHPQQRNTLCTSGLGMTSCNGASGSESKTMRMSRRVRRVAPPMRSLQARFVACRRDEVSS